MDKDLNQLETVFLALMRRHEELAAGNEHIEAIWLLGDDVSITKYLSWRLFKQGFPVLVEKVSPLGDAFQELPQEEAEKLFALAAYFADSFEGIVSDRFFSDSGFTYGSVADSHPLKQRALMSRFILKRWVQLWFENEKRFDALISRIPVIRESLNELEAAPKRTIYLGEAHRAPISFVLHEEELLPNVEAARLLLGLATSSRVDRIKICKRLACQKVYIQRDERANRYYCERNCGNSAPRPVNARAKEDRLQAARCLLAQVPAHLQDSSGRPAKDWLRTQCKRGGMTLSFITRNLKNKNLPYPEWWTQPIAGKGQWN